MYIPPEGFVPENMDDSDVQLKTILLWNGVGKVSNNVNNNIFWSQKKHKFNYKLDIFHKN